jgi:serine kinase of HPr protein (carbohydrate metabolism regulator)
MLLVHGTTIAIKGVGILIRGPSGSGKSDLALRLMDEGARLVADDQTRLSAHKGRLWASSPASIAGLMEVRGLGIVTLPHKAKARLGLVVDLVAEADIERLPDPDDVEFLEIRVMRVALAAFHASSSAKVRLAAALAKHDSRRS